MTEPTEADRERAADVMEPHLPDDLTTSAWDYLIENVAAALASERERAIEPFTALADEMQRQVEFRREGDPESLVADVRETDLRWLRLAISNARDPR